VALRAWRSGLPAARAGRFGAAAPLALAVLLAGGCQGGGPAAKGPVHSGASATPAATSGTTSTAPPSPSVPKGPAHVTVSPASTSAHIRPDTTVVVKVRSGTIASVRVADAAGGVVGGVVSGSGKVWLAGSLLKPHTAYRVTARAVGTNGVPVTKVAKFTTRTPTVNATYGLQPTGTVGVGMPVVVQFASPVSSSGRAEVEKHISLTMTPAQEGAWGWQDSSQLMWRPSSYWKAGTTVHVSAALQGVRTGSGKYVGRNQTSSFTVGDSMVSSVDIKTHTMTVERNGALVRTIPVSTGRPGARTETRSGTKVIMTREPVHVMDSASVGIPKGAPDYYHIVAKWAMRITWTGEFLHSAPWSVRSQGHVNVSHGCTNLSPSNAKWLYDHSRLGDVVEFTGSNRRFTASEGIGVWTYSYADWKSRSALA
jgi:lipoprotein-anchoring transpeptidase ErfK/SrfK